MYPLLDINLSGITDNLYTLKKECDKQNISLCLVTKMLSGYRVLVEFILDKTAVSLISDSRIANLAEFEETDAVKWLIRPPMESEIEDVIKYSDASFNTEMKTVFSLNEEAKKQGKIHKIILLAECGDLRDGCYFDELEEIIEKSRMLENIEIYGIATNLSCVNETLPDEENMKYFEETVLKLQEKFKFKFKVVSGGASSSIKMLFDKKLPKIINNLRFGEGVYLGNIPVLDVPFENAKKNNFILKAQIIECKMKPNVANTKLKDAKALKKRAVVALGKQDIYLPGLSPVDEKAKIAGGSSDHIIVDVTDCEKDYGVGDEIAFKMNYNCLLNAMDSKYIEKRIIS